MAAWMNLLGKELRLGRRFFYGVLIFMVLIALIGIGMAIYHPYGIITVGAVASTFMLMFYLLVYMIVSLSNEKNSYSVWMQMPLPGWSLITAKLAAGFVYLMASLVAMMILTWTIMQFDGKAPFMDLMIGHENQISQGDMTDINLFSQFIQYIKDAYLDIIVMTLPIIIGGGFVIAAGYLIFYFSYKTLQRWIGRWGILAAVVLVMVSMRIYEFISNSAVRHAFDWGHVPMKFPTFMSGSGEEYVHAFHESVSVGNIVLDLILVGLVVFISGWLLDKKVEVR